MTARRAVPPLAVIESSTGQPEALGRVLDAQTIRLPLAGDVPLEEMAHAGAILGAALAYSAAVDDAAEFRHTEYATLPLAEAVELADQRAGVQDAADDLYQAWTAWYAYLDATGQPRRAPLAVAS